MGQSFKDLVVWQKSMVLAKSVYSICKQIPKAELYGLVSQMQRSAISIPSNLAEGSKRGTSKDFRQFVSIARGSAAELETQLLLAREVYSLNVASELSDLAEIQKMLEKLWQSLTKD